MPESEIILRLVVACIIGGAIGFEREYLSKSAGFRTLIMISLGSCLFTIFSIYIANTTPDRIASNIVTGIGFLGAGVIFRDDNRVKGLTTAATIWVTAALGMGVGGGYYKVCITGAVFALIALYLLTYLEDWIDTMNQSHNYRIACHYKDESLENFEQLFRRHHLKFKRKRRHRVGEKISGTWMVNGSRKNHEAFIKDMLKDDAVLEFEF